MLTCAAPYVNPDRKKPIPLEKLEDAFIHNIRNIHGDESTYSGALEAFGLPYFNIFEINEVLFEFDMPLLGSGMN